MFVNRINVKREKLPVVVNHGRGGVAFEVWVQGGSRPFPIGNRTENIASKKAIYNTLILYLKIIISQKKPFSGSTGHKSNRKFLH
jgi:hypothetical protein